MTVIKEIELFNKYSIGTVAIIPFKIKNPILRYFKGWRQWTDEYGNTIIHKIVEINKFVSDYQKKCKKIYYNNAKDMENTNKQYGQIVKMIEFVDKSGVKAICKAFYWNCEGYGYLDKIIIEGFYYSNINKRR